MMQNVRGEVAKTVEEGLEGSASFAERVAGGAPKVPGNERFYDEEDAKLNIYRPLLLLQLQAAELYFGREATAGDNTVGEANATVLYAEHFDMDELRRVLKKLKNGKAPTCSSFPCKVGIYFTSVKQGKTEFYLHYQRN